MGNRLSSCLPEVHRASTLFTRPTSHSWAWRTGTAVAAKPYCKISYFCNGKVGTTLCAGRHATLVLVHGNGSRNGFPAATGMIQRSTSRHADAEFAGVSQAMVIRPSVTPFIWMCWASARTFPIPHPNICKSVLLLEWVCISVFSGSADPLPSLGSVSAFATLLARQLAAFQWPHSHFGLGFRLYSFSSPFTT